MGGFLGFLQGTWYIFIIIALLMGIGIAGYFVDKNTDILSIEKMKRELKEKSMDVEMLKSLVEDKNVSLSGAMGIVPHGGGNLDNSNANINVNANNINGPEDLNVPLDLNSH